VPYQVHEDTYAANPLFVWQAPKPVPEYRHPIIERFWTGWVLDLYQLHHTPGGMLQLTWVKVLQVVLFYFGIWLLIPLAAVWWALRDRWVRLALMGFAFLMTGLTQVYCYCPHYAAPAAVLIFILVTAGLRRLWVCRRAGRPVGRALVWGIALGYPVLAVLSTFLEPAVPADATHVQ